LNSYWSKVLQRRIDRRRAIVGTASVGGAAAFLAACGSDDSTGDSTSTGGSSTPEDNGLVAKIVNTSAQAKRGGTYVYPARREPLHFDGKAQGQVQLNVFNGLAYESLVRNKPGEGKPSTWTEVLPNLSESWELSPDKTTITFKLRKGVKWQNRPPINGREFDAEDVSATWKRYEEADTPNNKFTNSNNLNPAAPIISMTPTDKYTLVLKLAEPATYIFQRLATMITGELGSIYPKEAGGSFDPKTDQIGTGPWELDRFTPSVGISYKRNQTYWGKTGYFDVIDMPVLNEYSAPRAVPHRRAVLRRRLTGGLHPYQA